MNWSLLIIAIAACPACLLGQLPDPPSTLTVKGTYSFVEYPTSYRFWLTLEENSNKCDPVKGFVTLEEQQQSLLDTARARGLKIGPIESKLVFDNIGPYVRKKSIGITLPDQQSVDIFEAILTSQGLLNGFQMAIFLPRKAVMSDEIALEVLRDARRQAERVAEVYGKTISSVLNIADDSFTADSFSQVNGEGIPTDFFYLDHSFFVPAHPTNRKIDVTEELYLTARNSSFSLFVTFLLE